MPELTDITKEPESTFKLYGDEAKKPGSFANSVLMARRLVEAGVPLVTLAIHAHEVAFGRRHFRAFQEAFGSSVPIVALGERVRLLPLDGTHRLPLRRLVEHELHPLHVLLRDLLLLDQGQHRRGQADGRGNIQRAGANVDIVPDHGRRALLLHDGAVARLFGDRAATAILDALAAFAGSSGSARPAAGPLTTGALVAAAVGSARAAGSPVQPPFWLMIVSTGKLWRIMVSNSMAFMPKEPSPCSTITCLSGLASFAPIANPRPAPSCAAATCSAASPATSSD